MGYQEWERYVLSKKIILNKTKHIKLPLQSWQSIIKGMSSNINILNVIWLAVRQETLPPDSRLIK